MFFLCHHPFHVYDMPIEECMGEWVIAELIGTLTILELIIHSNTVKNFFGKSEYTEYAIESYH